MVKRTYTYSLARKGKWHCPECGHKTFVCYVDDEGCILNECVGKCDRADNCGYHYPPRSYFADNGVTNVEAWVPKYQVVPQPKPSFIDTRLFTESLSNPDSNRFVCFLLSLFCADIVSDLVGRYFIGASTHWGGATIFWQIDRYGHIHGGKIMQYDPTTGKRVKKPHSRITWVHSALKLQDYNLVQCLFGEHLLRNNNSTVAVVESEKTAIIASGMFGDCVVVACGGCGNLTAKMCEALRGRDVILFPDNGKYYDWEAKALSLEYLFAHARISSIMETHAAAPGDDIGDLFVQHIMAGREDEELQAQLTRSIVALY